MTESIGSEGQARPEPRGGSGKVPGGAESSEKAVSQDAASLQPQPKTQQGWIARFAACFRGEARCERALLAIGIALAAISLAASASFLPAPAWLVSPAAVLAAAAVGILSLQRTRAFYERRSRLVVEAILEAAKSNRPAALPVTDPVVRALKIFADSQARRAQAMLDRLSDEKEAEKQRAAENAAQLEKKLREEFEAKRAEIERESSRKDDTLRAVESELSAIKERFAQHVAEAERARAEAETREAELRGRIAELEKQAEEKETELQKLRSEAQTIAAQADAFRRQRVQFFDRLASQLRGHLQILGKLAAELVETRAAGASRAPAGADTRATDPAQEMRARLSGLDRLLDEIIELSRLESGALSLVFSEIEVARFVRVSLCELEEAARSKGVQLATEVPENLPAVRTDSRLSAKILRELVSNAVKFTPKGGRVVVRAAVRDESKGSARLEIEVADTGPGIPPEDLERIFSPFERCDEGRFTVVDSPAGLGLTLARGYARLLGGDLKAESAVGVGSTFRLSIPVKALARVPA